jgi:hypothetical protein
LDFTNTSANAHAISDSIPVSSAITDGNTVTDPDAEL